MKIKKKILSYTYLTLSLTLATKKERRERKRSFPGQDSPNHLTNSKRSAIPILAVTFDGIHMGYIFAP